MNKPRVLRVVSLSAVVLAVSSAQAHSPTEAGVYLAMSRYRPTPAEDSRQGVSYTYSVVVEAAE